MNYQALLKCWDDAAVKQHLNDVNGTFSQMYTELRVAEIFVGGGSGLYAVLINLKATESDQTEIEAFGTGWIGETKVPEWIEVFENCAATNKNK